MLFDSQLKRSVDSEMYPVVLSYREVCRDDCNSNRLLYLFFPFKTSFKVITVFFHFIIKLVDTLRFPSGSGEPSLTMALGLEVGMDVIGWYLVGLPACLPSPPPLPFFFSLFLHRFCCVCCLCWLYIPNSPASVSAGVTYMYLHSYQVVIL